MPRKRAPLVIEGSTVVLDAPGLEPRDRGNRTEWYWVASKDARKAGYIPRTVRLHGDFTLVSEAERMAARCRVLWQEMLDWQRDPEGQSVPIYDGTVKSLIDCFQRDPESSYRTTNVQSTRGCYDDWCKTLVRLGGMRRVDRLTGRDMRKWFMTILEPAAPGGPPRLRLARGCVRQMMPILLSYGAEVGLPGCIDLLQVLDKMVLRVPREVRVQWKKARGKKVAMSFEQAEAIVAEGLRRGTRSARSVALGVAAQFEFTLRQIDAIGFWEKSEGIKSIPKGAIAKSGKVHKGGLSYEQIAGEVFDLTTTKNSTDAVYDITEYPLFMRALAAVPLQERAGLLCIDNGGLPFQKRYYASLFRSIATAAGVPLNVWNARARHGGLSEGYHAIVERAGDGTAELADLKYHGQHNNLEVTLGQYVDGGVKATRRVAKARVATRPVRIKGEPVQLDLLGPHVASRGKREVG